MKIGVLSDIHSAAEHFRDALEAARDEGVDQLVILGDLLTYGPEPMETLEIAEEAASRDRAIFITGNHDLLYVSEGRNQSYSWRLSDWIRETVDWTSAQVRDSTAIDRLPWQTEWAQDGVLFSHANPFGFGDWTYLRDDQSMSRASSELQARSLELGVFGHVHRFRLFAPENGRGRVATVGSIGQPRDIAEPFSQWAVVNTGPEPSVEQRPLARDWNSTIDKIRKTSMSDATKERLCQFYE